MRLKRSFRSDPPSAVPIVGPAEGVHLSVDDLLARMESGARGLASEEAASRLGRYGRNELPEPARRRV
ncbi:MAG: cation-transporting P-type ATPase [Dehalococcoidia bacterium]